MNKKIIIIIAVSLAIILIGVAVVFAIKNSNDTSKGDEAVKDDSDKDIISSESDDLETTGVIDSEFKETEREEVETDEPSDESTSVTEKETQPSDKEPADTKPAETKPADTKPADTKPAETKPAETKPADTKPAETKPADTKPADTKPADTKPVETKPVAPDRNEFASADFTIYDGDGNKVRLSDFAGKPIILNFWASWCVPCKKEMPDFNEKYLEYGDEIQFLMVDFARDDKIEDAQKYVSDMGFEFPVYYDIDGDAFLAYEITAFPTTIVFDADGNVVDRYRGTISGETLQSVIDKILD